MSFGCRLRRSPRPHQSLAEMLESYFQDGADVRRDVRSPQSRSALSAAAAPMPPAPASALAHPPSSKSIQSSVFYPAISSYLSSCFLEFLTRLRRSAPVGRRFHANHQATIRGPAKKRAGLSPRPCLKESSSLSGRRVYHPSGLSGLRKTRSGTSSPTGSYERRRSCR